jgi:hypothetical protein
MQGEPEETSISAPKNAIFQDMIEVNVRTGYPLCVFQSYFELVSDEPRRMQNIPKGSVSQNCIMIGKLGLKPEGETFRPHQGRFVQAIDIVFHHGSRRGERSDPLLA